MDDLPIPAQQQENDSVIQRFCVPIFFVILSALVVVRPAKADVIQFFDSVVGQPTGEFGCDEFGATGSPYAGPHAPDQFSTGIGSGELLVTPGGLITSTNNLYSFFSVPTWSVEISELEDSQSFSSVALQIATSSTLDSSRFSLNGAAPDEFLDLGQRAEVGGFPYNFYWAEWQGESRNPIIQCQ